MAMLKRCVDSCCHGNIGGTDSADDCDHSVRIDRQLQQRKYRKR